jgi:hypothetical protein
MAYRIAAPLVAVVFAIVALLSGVSQASPAGLTRPQVAANLLTVRHLTNQYDHWKEQWANETPHKKNQKGVCNVLLPSSQFEIIKDWFDSASVLNESDQADSFLGKRQAHKAVRLSYNGEKRCKSYAIQGTTFYPTGRFEHHFAHTTAYCTTQKSYVTSGSESERLNAGQCRFVRKNIRYDVYVATVGGVATKMETLTTRAVHKVWARK